MCSWRHGECQFCLITDFDSCILGWRKTPMILVGCCLQVGWCFWALIGYWLVCKGTCWTWKFGLDHQQTQCHYLISSLLWLDLWSHIPWCYDSSTLYSMYPVWLVNEIQKPPSSLSASETAAFSSMSLLRFEPSCEDIKCHLGQVVTQKINRLLLNSHCYHLDPYQLRNATIESGLAVCVYCGNIGSHQCC